MLGGCDIRIACPEAKFAVMEPKRGLFAGGGTTVRLPRQVPWAQAMEFLLCADLIPAERAYEMGLLNAIVPRDELLDAAPRVRARIIANAPLAVQATKESALKGLYVDEDAITQLREALAPRLSAALQQIDPGEAATAQGAIAASVEVLNRLGKELRTAFEKESRISSAIFQTEDRQGRPQSVRREAQAGVESPMTVDPRTPCIIGVATHTWHPEDVGAAGAPEPLEMWEHVAPRRRNRCREPQTETRILLAALDSIQIVYCQSWQYDDAVARLSATGRCRSPASPLFGNRRDHHAAARQRNVRGDAARRDGSCADHERGGTGDQEAQQTRRRTLGGFVRTRRQAALPVGVAARSDRSRARGVSRPGSRLRCSTVRAGASSASGSTRTARRSARCSRR